MASPDFGKLVNPNEKGTDYAHHIYSPIPRILRPSYGPDHGRRGLPYMCQKEVISLRNTYMAAGKLDKLPVLKSTKC